MKYLVLGLPRSRTSWLSIALTATHEYLSNGGDATKLSDEVGCVEINPFLQYEDCPTVCIVRDYNDVAESLYYFTGSEEVPDLVSRCKEAYDRLLEVAKERNALLIPYEFINDSREEISTHLGVDIDKNRWDYLCSYRVEPMAEDISLITNSVNYK